MRRLRDKSHEVLFSSDFRKEKALLAIDQTSHAFCGRESCGLLIDVAGHAK